MSFLPDYEDDIFISYAHNDNQALMEGQRGWVDVFHQALERRLQVHLGAKAAIWRDPRLQGNEYFADTLVEQIPDRKSTRLNSSHLVISYAVFCLKKKKKKK